MLDGEVVERAACGVGRGDDPPVGVLEPLLYKATGESEGEGGLQRRPALGDDVDVDALAVEVRHQLLVVPRREVVTGEQDLRAARLERRAERLHHGLGPEVRAPDPYTKENVGPVADFGSRLDHALEERIVGGEEHLAPAEHLRAPRLPIDHATVRGENAVV